MNPVIQIENATRRFGTKLALNNFSLQVPSGCVFALLGENGAGKTTAIRSIIGLDCATTGKVEVLGMDPKTNGIEVRRRVGYVPDSPALYDWMSVAQIGGFTASFYDSSFLSNYEAAIRRYEIRPEQKIRHLSRGNGPRWHCRSRCLTTHRY